MLKRIVFVFCFVFAIFSVFLYQGNGSTAQTNLLLSVSSFFFGIFVAFSTSNSQARFNNIHENLKKEEGSLLFCYYLAKSFGDKIQLELRTYIDNYLMATIDYKLADYQLAEPELERLLNYSLSLKPKTKVQEITFDKLLGQIEEISTNRKQTEVMISQSLSTSEWGSILALLAVIVGLLIYSNSGSLLSITVSILLIIVAFVLVVTLWSIDSLSRNRKNYIWSSLATTFTRMQLLPYFHSSVVGTKDFPTGMFNKRQEFRVPIFKTVYPDLSQKRITIVQLR
jgi:hypothetical protein